MSTHLLRDIVGRFEPELLGGWSFPSVWNCVCCWYGIPQIIAKHPFPARAQEQKAAHGIDLFGIRCGWGVPDGVGHTPAAIASDDVDDQEMWG